MLPSGKPITNVCAGVSLCMVEMLPDIKKIGHVTTPASIGTICHLQSQFWPQLHHNLALPLSCNGSCFDPSGSQAQGHLSLMRVMEDDCPFKDDFDIIMQGVAFKVMGALFF